MTDEILKRAVEFAEKGEKGTTIDLENRRIVFVMWKNVTEEKLMAEEMLGDWYKKNGFNLAFEVRDVEYMTKGTFDAHSCTNYRGHKAYLRNRTVMTITW